MEEFCRKSDTAIIVVVVVAFRGERQLRRAHEKRKPAAFISGIFETSPKVDWIRSAGDSEQEAAK